MNDGGLLGFHFNDREELYKFLYGQCTREERRELMRRLGESILEEKE